MSSRFHFLGIILLSLTFGCTTNFESQNLSEDFWPDRLESCEYYFTPKMFGSVTNIGLNRDGFVSYSFASKPETSSGGQGDSKQWTIPPEEAGKILDSLIESGILDIEETGSERYPMHAFDLSANKGWRKSIHTTNVPPEISESLKILVDSRIRSR